MRECVGTSKPNKKTLCECQLRQRVYVCVERVFSLCFNSAILSLITLWQRLYISSGVGAAVAAQVERKGRIEERKEERGEGVMGKGSDGGGGRSRGASVSVSACPPLSAGCA